MNGIIKTIKTTEYLQMHNKPAQTLTDLKSIGLLAHLMSLPEGWQIRKMQLFNKFGRGPVNTAFKELEENRYLFTVKCRDGKKDVYGYFVTDVAFTDEQIEAIVKQIELPILEIKASNFHCRFSTSQKNDQISSVDFRQSKMDNPKQTPINKIDNKKIDINKKISSSRESIDCELKEKFSEVPFDQIKDELLNDDTVTIKTDKQYKSMLIYRLENYKPTKPKKFRKSKPVRKEIAPEWLHNENETQVEEQHNMSKEEFEKEKAALFDRIKNYKKNNQFIKIKGDF